MRIYPGGPLHDGRPVGRLQPHVERLPGSLRHRRGQLLRPRSQPARRQCADAGPGGRLLRCCPTRSVGYFAAPARSASVERGWAPSSCEAERKPAASASDEDHARDRRSIVPSTSFHRDLGKIMWDHVRDGPQRPRPGLEAKERIQKIPALRGEFWENVSIPGGLGRTSTRPSSTPAGWPTSSSSPNSCVDDAARPRGVLRRPLPRGAFQTEEGEAKRNDDVVLATSRSLGVPRRCRQRRRNSSTASPSSSRYVKPSQRSYRSAANTGPCASPCTGLASKRTVRNQRSTWRRTSIEEISLA